MKAFSVAILVMALLAICARTQSAEETSSQKIDDNNSQRIDDDKSQRIDDDKSQRIDDDQRSQPIDGNSNSEPLLTADGSAPTEEEVNDKLNMSADEMKKKLEEFQMMQHFFCFIGVKKYLNDMKKDVQSILEPHGQKAAQKLLSSTFEACLEDTLKEETMNMMMNIKSQDQLASLEFPFFKSFPLEKFGAEAKFDLTDDDKENLKTFEKVQKQFDKMYKKKKGKSAKSDDEDDDVSEDVKSTSKKQQKQKPTTSMLNYAVLLLVIGLLVVLAKAAIKATSNDAKPLSSKEKKSKEGKGQKLKM